MKYIPHIAGALLGLLFIFASLVFLTGNIPPQEPPPKDSASEHFGMAFGPTGYFTLVKVLELIGGILVAIPKTRNFGLLILGPIIVNILAFHLLVARDSLLHPMILGPIALAGYLLWAGRRQFLALKN